MNPATEETQLTERERAVAIAIASGRERTEIAQSLGMAPKTFDTHRAHALAKLGVSNNVKLTHLALRKGWITL